MIINNGRNSARLNIDMMERDYPCFNHIPPVFIFHAGKNIELFPDSRVKRQVRTRITLTARSDQS